MIGRIGPFPAELACCMGCGQRSRVEPYLDNTEAWRGREPRIDYGDCTRCGGPMTNAKEWAASIRAERRRMRRVCARMLAEGATWAAIGVALDWPGDPDGVRAWYERRPRRPTAASTPAPGPLSMVPRA
ncbi:hypothetical protein [Luteitalea sp.]